MEANTTISKEQHTKAPKIPLITSIKNLPKLLKDPVKLLSSQFEKYGTTFKTYVALNEVYLTIDADCIQHFMQKGHRQYKKTEFTQKIGEVIGNGLLTAEGDYWRQQRRLIQPGFHKKKLEALSNIITSDIQKFSKNLESELNKTEPTKLMLLMMQLTIKVVLNSLFSNSIANHQVNRFDEIITAFQQYIVFKIRMPGSGGILKLTGRNTKIEKMVTEIDDIIYKIISDRKSHLNNQNIFDDLLDMLLQAKYEDTGKGMTHQQLRDECMVMLLAGHETSAVTLTWTFYLLSQHPEIEQKVLAEIKKVVGNRLPEFNDLMALTYTKQVIQEAMRLFPPAWILDREAINENKMGQYQVKKGQVVTAFVYGLHHNPTYWENPETFIPERFAPERIKARHPFSYMPFGGGPRLCIGNHFAYMEMQLALAILLPKFKFEPFNNQTPTLEGLITLRPKDGLPVNIRLRN